MSYYRIQIENCVNFIANKICVSKINLNDLETRLLTPSGIFNYFSKDQHNTE
jgi:hypothetical protein